MKDEGEGRACLVTTELAEGCRGSLEGRLIGMLLVGRCRGAPDHLVQPDEPAVHRCAVLVAMNDGGAAEKQQLDGTRAAIMRRVDQCRRSPYVGVVKGGAAVAQDFDAGCTTASLDHPISAQSLGRGMALRSEFRLCFTEDKGSKSKRWRGSRMWP